MTTITDRQAFDVLAEQASLLHSTLYPLADGRMVLVDVGASRVLTDVPAVAEELLRRMAVNAGLHYLGTGNAKP